MGLIFNGVILIHEGRWDRRAGARYRFRPAALRLSRCTLGLARFCNLALSSQRTRKLQQLIAACEVYQVGAHSRPSMLQLPPQASRMRATAANQAGWLQRGCVQPDHSDSYCHIGLTHPRYPRCTTALSPVSIMLLRTPNDPAHQRSALSSWGRWRRVAISRARRESRFPALK